MEKFNIRPLAVDERNLFFPMKPEENKAHGTIGVFSFRFAKRGKTIWCSWHPIGPEKLVTSTFKEECNAIVKELGQNVLSGLAGMKHFCSENGGQIEGDWTTTYGYIIDTPNYLCCLRCVPVRCDYNANLIFYDKQSQVQHLAAQSQAEENQEIQIGEM